MNGIVYKSADHIESSGTCLFKIENFSQYNEMDQVVVSSDLTLTTDDVCKLHFYPHGQKCNNGVYISLYLQCKTVKNIIKSSSRLMYEFSIISANFEKKFEVQGCYLADTVWGLPNFVRKATLLAQKDLYLPNDILTISCKITRSTRIFATEKISVSVSRHVYNLEYLVEHKNLGDIVTLRIGNKRPQVNQQESSTTSSSLPTRSSVRLSQRQLKTKNNKINEVSENTVGVLGAKNFQVYKGVLTSQSPVFEAMFQHKETQENQNNVVEIEDMDPEICGDMLHFLYHDELRVSENNIMELLAVADKYQFRRLKDLCEEALFKELTKENSLVALSGADFYNADQLKRATIDFIVEHFDEIKKSDEYELFKKEKSALALEIFEKVYKMKMRND